MAENESKAAGTQTPAADSKNKKVCLRSDVAAGLTVVKEDGTSERFTVYYEVFKGDTVKVGFLETDDAEVAKKALAVTGVTEVTADEFAKATKELDRAPAFSM